MSDRRRLPRLGESLSVYRSVRDISTETPASVAEVADGLGGSPEEDDLRRQLDLLVAYGLLDRRTEGYTLRCRPDDPVERWQALAADRAAVLHEAVARETDETTDAAVLESDGRRYAVVEVRGQTTLDELFGRVKTVRTDDTAGVVLTTPGETANELKRLVDDVEASGRSNLEMVDAEVVEAGDGFQYRSYLEAQ